MNHSSSTTLQIDKSPDLHFLLKFTVTGVNGQAVTNAKLRLTLKHEEMELDRHPCLPILYSSVARNFYGSFFVKHEQHDLCAL
jgi:hypothetical protein